MAVIFTSYEMVFHICPMAYLPLAPLRKMNPLDRGKEERVEMSVFLVISSSLKNFLIMKKNYFSQIEMLKISNSCNFLLAMTNKSLRPKVEIEYT